MPRYMMYKLNKYVFERNWHNFNKNATDGLEVCTTIYRVLILLGT